MHPQSCLILCGPMGHSPPVSSVQGFSRQAYWSGLPFPPPVDLPNPGIEPVFPASPALQADSLLAEPTGLLDLPKCCLLSFLPPLPMCLLRRAGVFSFSLANRIDWEEEEGIKFKVKTSRNLPYATESNSH